MQTTAKEIMDRSAALLNDVALSIFTYAYQIPYLNAAMDELQELFEENNIAVTNQGLSNPIAVDANVTEIGFTGANRLPADLIEIQKVYERPRNTTYDWVLMTRKEFLPVNVTPINQLIYWSWQDQKIKFIGANANNDIKLDYIKSLFAPVIDENTVINVINCKSFLSYRTAALCAEFIGENPSRAESLNTSAALAISRALNINVKGAQVLPTRRRPFMANYRRRGFIT